MYPVYCGLILLISFTGHASATDATNDASFAIGFMDITPDRNEVGFVQFFAVSTNFSAVILQGGSGELSDVALIDGSLDTYYNTTHNWNELTVTPETNDSFSTHSGFGVFRNQLGVLASASAGEDVHVFGVKSDKGTTDGFMALPLTTTSTEFFVAAWNCTHRQFYGALQVVSPLEDTCVEIYRVDGDVYELQKSMYMNLAFETYLYTSSFGVDVTGYFINSSRPIAVYAGHACAFVPEDVFFCDHMVEQIPPLDELGNMYIVPPIMGRDPNAGYVVRVVAAYVSTQVQWQTMNRVTTGTQVITRGHFVHIYSPTATQPMKVECSKPCLVMLYNTGRNAVNGGRADAVPTDPFMMLIAPTSGHDHAAAFATGSFCEIQNNVQFRQDFSNQLAIVTDTASIGDIMLDGRPVSSVTPWSTASNWGFSYTTLPVSHGKHVVTVTPGSNAMFSAYLYGHSLIDTSSSAYGYTVGFRVTGQLYNNAWDDAKNEVQESEKEYVSYDCQEERFFSGSAVAQHPSAANPNTLRNSIQLSRSVNSDPMSQSCRERYRTALAADLRNVSRTINFLICNLTMCPYLSGAPGTGVTVNPLPWAVISPHLLFAAIDTASLTDPVSFEVDSTGSIKTASVSVPFTGLMDTTADTFTRCRVEVRQYLRQFTNWPQGTDLLPTLSGCPPITFAAPYEFVRRSLVCTL